LRLPDYWNNKLIVCVALDVVQGLASLYQPWKCQVLPGITAIGPSGDGIPVRSSDVEKLRSGPPRPGEGAPAVSIQRLKPANVPKVPTLSPSCAA
jgi:hypothetical protein